MTDYADLFTETDIVVAARNARLELTLMQERADVWANAHHAFGHAVMLQLHRTLDNLRDSYDGRFNIKAWPEGKGFALTRPDDGVRFIWLTVDITPEHLTIGCWREHEGQRVRHTTPMRLDWRELSDGGTVDFFENKTAAIKQSLRDYSGLDPFLLRRIQHAVIYELAASKVFHPLDRDAAPRFCP